MSTTTLSAAIRTALQDALTTHPTLRLIGETVGRAGGIAGTTAGLQAHFGADRVIDLPVADRGNAGFAVGLALAGTPVVLTLAGAERLLAILEVLTDSAQMGSQGEFRLPLVIRVPTGGSDPVGQAGIAAATACASVTVMTLSSPGQAAPLLQHALSAQRPVVLLEPVEQYGQRLDDSPRAASSHQHLAGEHVTIATWGSGVSAALDAANRLAADGVSAGVVELVQLHPVETEPLGEALRHTGRLVVAAPGGAHAQPVLQAGLRDAFLYLESPMMVSEASSDAIHTAAHRSVQY